MEIVPAEVSECDEMLALFPELASFDVPNDRNPDHLWLGDADTLRAWADGRKDSCLVHVARDDDGSVLGMTMVSLGSEMLSHSPSAHLEVIVVSPRARGKGVGGALLQAAENAARNKGALSMSLHVFAQNKTARDLYAKAGFDGELMRYIKVFEKGALQ